MVKVYKGRETRKLTVEFKIKTRVGWGANESLYSWLDGTRDVGCGWAR